MKKLWAQLMLLVIFAFSSWEIAGQGVNLIAIQVSPSGEYLAELYSNGAISIINLSNQTELVNLTNVDIVDFSWNPVNTNMLITITRSSDVSILDVSTGNYSYQFTLDGIAYSISFDPSATQIVTGHTDETIGPFSVGYIRITNLSTGLSNKYESTTSQRVVETSWSPTGDLIAGLVSGDTPQKLNLWDASNGTNVQSFSNEIEITDEEGTSLTGNLSSFAWNSTGSYIAIDRISHIDIVRSNTFTTEITTDQIPAIADMAWNPQLNMIAVATDVFQSIYLIDTISGEIINVIDTLSTVSLIEWSSNGQELIYVQDGQNLVTESSPFGNAERILEIVLTNADSDSDTSTLSTNSTETIDIANNDISLRANTDPATVGSVVFTVDGNVVATDNSAPYTIAGESGSNILPWNIALGQHTVVATPYSGADGTGDTGTPLTVQVNIVDSSQSGLAVTSLTLINADTDTEIRTLSTTSTETIDITNNTVSIRANTNPSTVGSVVFTLGSTIIQTESIAPYTIAGDQSSGTNYNPWNVSPGTYQLTVTPYDGSGGTGNAGTPIVVDLQVMDNNLPGGECTATGGLVQEGEAGVLAGNFVIASDPIASGGQYVHVPEGTGSYYSPGSSSNVSFCFPVIDAGTYRLRAWVYAADSGSDSFYIDYNGAEVAWYTEINTIYSIGYVRAPGTPINSAEEYTLSSGNQEFTFFLREDGTRLDKVELLNMDSGETVLYRVDAGASSAYTDTLGNVWAADSNFSGGSANSFPATILSTIDDPLYTTERSQSNNVGFSYSFPVSNGTYTVRLHFAEIWFTGGSGRGALDSPTARRRVFDIQLEGITVLDEFHIVSETLQPRVAHVETLSVNVTDGTLNINFPPATTDNPTIEAIEIVQGG